MFRINENFSGPQAARYFFPGDKSAPSGGQQDKQFQRLAFDAHGLKAAAQFKALAVQLELAELEGADGHARPIYPWESIRPIMENSAKRKLPGGLSLYPGFTNT